MNSPALETGYADMRVWKVRVFRKLDEAGESLILAGVLANLPIPN